MPEYITKDGLEKIKKELKQLKTEKRKEIAERLKKAISYGDLKENAAYHEAKDAQAFMEGRIIELGRLLNSAVLINSANIRKDKVGIGSKVIVENISATGRDEFLVVGSAIEANPIEGKISVGSPLGKELLNKKEGDSLCIKAPNGLFVNYKILAIK